MFSTGEVQLAEKDSRIRVLEDHLRSSDSLRDVRDDDVSSHIISLIDLSEQRVSVLEQQLKDSQAVLAEERTYCRFAH